MKLEELHEGKIIDKIKSLFKRQEKWPETEQREQDMHTNDDELFDFANDKEYDTATKLLKMVTNSPLGGIGVEKSSGDIHIADDNGIAYTIHNGKIKVTGRDTYA